jgi:hypothetical protein
MTRPADNPFRMQQLDRIAFQPQSLGWPALLSRLDAHKNHAAIVGPHGSGKTTLLDSLDAHFSGRGVPVRRLHMTEEEGRGLPDHWRASLRRARVDEVIFADGYDLLGPFGRRYVRRGSRRCAGLIVTAHRPTRLPTLIHCETTPALLHQLTQRLLGRPLPRQTVETLYRQHHGNLRKVFRALYDQVGRDRDPVWHIITPDGRGWENSGAR